MNELSSDYSVRVKSHLDPNWMATFSAYEMKISHTDVGGAHTTLRLQVKDQAHLIGILTEMHGMGLKILAVHDQSEPTTEGISGSAVQSEAPSQKGDNCE